MDTEYESQSFAYKQNKQMPLTPQGYITGAEVDEEKLDIGWLFAVMRRRVLIMVCVGISLVGITGGLILRADKRIPKEYVGSLKLLVEPVTAESKQAQLSSAALTGPGSSDIQRINIQDSNLDYDTQVRILQSSKILYPIFQKIKDKYPELTYSKFKESININRIAVEKDGQTKGTKILDISYKDSDQKRIEYVLKELSDAYLKYSLQERLTSIRNGIKFIDSQLPELQARVDETQGKVRKLREKYNVMDPYYKSTQLLNHSLGVELLRIQNQAQLAQSILSYQNLQKQLQQKNYSLVLSSQAMAFDTLLKQLQNVESVIAQQSVQFKENSVVIQLLEAQRKELQNIAEKNAESLRQKLGGEIKEIEARNQSIAQQENIINQEMKSMPAMANELADLQRKADTAAESLRQFLAKKEALRIDNAQQEVPWELMEPPRIIKDKDGNPIPVAKNTGRTLGIAAVISILLGIGSGFLVEVLHKVFHTPEEIKAATKLSLLGVIPFEKNLKRKKSSRSKKLVTVGGEEEVKPIATKEPQVLLNTGKGLKTRSDKSASPFMESFRTLHTNIRLLSPDRPIQSVVIGATGQGEGKSTVAINLAQSAAAIGQRVLLVDANLRDPSLHIKLGLPNVRGLSDAIASDMSLNDAIQRLRSGWAHESPWEDNLFVLTSGQIPPDPIKLLSSKKMIYLMEQFQAFFDLVIYDTPPLLGLADGSILAAHTDGIVLIVGIESTDRTALKTVLDGLKISGASILGVVANGIQGYIPPRS